eukprot:TRINITY_DN11106_c0_g1_i4.p3 TRINITY_DN11106_c0_g1~~TRINITY_DN11106_c0_g1_i4.p3  ORF type:complete len:103 (+),score=1.13 TRINITY_DN11106_c0_g1_i4:311-619(+)
MASGDNDAFYFSDDPYNLYIIFTGDLDCDTGFELTASFLIFNQVGYFLNLYVFGNNQLKIVLQQIFSLFYRTLTECVTLILNFIAKQSMIHCSITKHQVKKL